MMGGYFRQKRDQRVSQMLIGMLTVLLVTGFVFGDVLYLRDGRVFQGRLIRQTDKEIVFEVHLHGLKMGVKYKKEEVKQIVEAPLVPAPKTSTQPGRKTRDTARDSATPICFVIPIRGTIGLQVTDEVFRKCLNTARAQKVGLVVLLIDSGGGSIPEMEKLIKRLQAYDDLRIVAYVQKAFSAAAMLAMSCKEIVIAPNGAIGAAVPYLSAPGRAPKNVTAKYESAYRGWCRGQVEKAGHSPLLVDAMVRMDMVLGLVGGGAGAKLVEGKGDKVIKRKGQILTLAGKEAVECGLALGLAGTIDQSKKLLGIKGWKVESGRSGRHFKAWAEKLKDGARRHNVILEKADDLWDRAQATNPSAFAYTVDSGGFFTKAAKRKWRQRSDACTKLLTKVETELAKEAALSGRYPQLVSYGLVKYTKAKTDEFRKRVVSSRREIEADRKRKGIPLD